MSENNVCAFPGCRQRFEHRMQCHRHTEKEHSAFLDEKRGNKKLPFTVTGEGKFSCIKCCRVFTQKTNVYKHLKDNRRGVEVSEKSSRTDCAHCGKRV